MSEIEISTHGERGPTGTRGVKYGARIEMSRDEGEHLQAFLLGHRHTWTRPKWYVRLWRFLRGKSPDLIYVGVTPGLGKTVYATGAVDWPHMKNPALRFHGKFGDSDETRL